MNSFGPSDTSDFDASAAHAQFLPPIMPSKYRRDGLVDDSAVLVDHTGSSSIASDLTGGSVPSQLEDPETERDRMFRLRAMYLQQQHLQERQKVEDQRRLALMQQQQQQRRQQQQFHQQQQQAAQLGMSRERRDATARESEYDLPRRIHRELQPPPQSAAPATAAPMAGASSPFTMRPVLPQPTPPLVAPPSVPAPAPVATAPRAAPPAASSATSLNLPLPPPLPSTARRFARSSDTAPRATRAPLAPSDATASPQIVPVQTPIEPLHPASAPVASRKTKALAPPSQQHASLDARTDTPEYFPGLETAAVAPQATAPRSFAASASTTTAVSVLGKRTAFDPNDASATERADRDDDVSESVRDAPPRRKAASSSSKRKASKAKAVAPAPPPVPLQPALPAPAPIAPTPTDAAAPPSAEPKRRCGRKSMNYSSEQKRERNRAAVKKCRQRQALKYEYLLRKAEVLETENQALSDMLVNNVDIEHDRRISLTRGIQMDILFKIKEIFTQSLPKDFVLDADSIWDLNSVLAVSMPSRCYYGIESIKEFWRTSLRMRNKGKIRSFWAWLFRLPPGDRFTEFDIVPFSDASNLYFITWTTKSEPPLAGSMVIMFGHGHRVTLHVECFGWLIWRYLLTNEPFPEPNE